MDILALSHEADTWLDAATAIQSYLRDLPANAAAAPSYLLEQIEVWAIVVRDDFPRAALNDREAAVIGGYLDVLTRNRSASVDIGAELVRLLDGHSETTALRRSSESLLAADAQYDGRMREILGAVKATCEDCEDSPFVQDLDPSTPDVAVLDARRSLAARIR